MDNLSYPQPIKYWLHLCRRHRPHLFIIGTFLMGIGVLVVLFHTNNTTSIGGAGAAAVISSSASSLPRPNSIQREREKRQTNQNAYEELQSMPGPSLQHKQSMSDLTVISAAAAARITTTTARSPSLFASFRNETVNSDAIVGNNERWPSTKRGQNRKMKHQSIAEGNAAHRHQSYRQRSPSLQQKNTMDSGSPIGVTRHHQRNDDTVSNGNWNRPHNTDGNNIENSVSDGSSQSRNHIPKINNNNFSLRSNSTSHYKVHAFARPNSTIGVGDVKRPLSLPVHRQPPSPFSNVKRKMYANSSIYSTLPSKKHVFHGSSSNDGYLVVRKYTCIMCKVIPGEPVRRPSQSLNNKQWNRGMCALTILFRFTIQLQHTICVSLPLTSIVSETASLRPRIQLTFATQFENSIVGVGATHSDADARIVSYLN